MRITIEGAPALECVESDYEDSNKTSFLYHVSRHFGTVQVHGAAQLLAVKYLQQRQDELGIKSVVEFFGGVGIGTAIIQKVLRPESHIVYEIDDVCINHLKNQAFADRITVEMRDAKEAMLDSTADLMYLDFFSFSAYRLKDWRRQLDAVFFSEPTAVEITDTSIARLPLQKERYAKALGRTFDGREDYAMAFSDKITREYGYKLAYYAYRENACMVFLPKDKVVAPTEFRRLNQTDGDMSVQRC